MRGANNVRQRPILPTTQHPPPPGRTTSVYSSTAAASSSSRSAAAAGTSSHHPPYKPGVGGGSVGNNGVGGGSLGRPGAVSLPIGSSRPALVGASSSITTSTRDGLIAAVIIFSLISAGSILLSVIAVTRDPASAADTVFSQCLTNIFFGNGTVLSNGCGFTTAGPASFLQNVAAFGNLSVAQGTKLGTTLTVGSTLGVSGDVTFAKNLSVAGTTTATLDNPSALSVCDRCPVPSDAVVGGICNNSACLIPFDQIVVTNSSDVQPICAACNFSFAVNVTSEIAAEVCASPSCVVNSSHVTFTNATVTDICTQCSTYPPSGSTIGTICSSMFCSIDSTQVTFEPASIASICASSSCNVSGSQIKYTSGNIANICNNTNCKVPSANVVFSSSSITSICASSSCNVSSSQVSFTSGSIAQICASPSCQVNATLSPSEIQTVCNTCAAAGFGTVTITGDLFVYGTTTLNQTVTMNSGLTVGGGVIVVGSAGFDSDVSVLGTLAANGNVTFANSLHVGVDLNVLSAARIGTTLLVGNGITITAGGLNIQTGALTVNNGFSLLGNGVLGSSVNVTGTLTAPTINATTLLRSRGSLSVNQTSTLTGAVTMGNTLSVSQNATFMQSVKVNKTLEVGGTLVVGSFSVSSLTLDSLTATQATITNLTVGTLTLTNLTVNLLQATTIQSTTVNTATLNATSVDTATLMASSVNAASLNATSTDTQTLTASSSITTGSLKADSANVTDLMSLGSTLLEGSITFGAATGATTTILFDNTTVCMSNSACTASDARLKRDVRALDPAAAHELVLRLRPVDYRWHEDWAERANLQPRDRREAGLLAQDVERLLPDAVSKRGSMRLNADITLHDLRALDKDQVFTYLLASHQHLARLVEEQRAELQQLKLRLM